MKFLQKWYYLILLAACGAVYLNCVDGWMVYTEPWRQIKAYYGDSEENEKEENTNTPVESERMPEQEETANAVEKEQERQPEGRPDTEEPQIEQQAEPVYFSVEDDYFGDAVFIGDSRTVGMYEYGGLEEVSTFYASTGLTVYKLFDSEIVKVPGRKKKITVEQALQANSFAKIYLMIGINEMGTGTVETFIAKYQTVLERLQELQPDAVIYVQGIMKVSTERSGQGDYITNEGIEARNAEIEKLADNEKIFYLDVNPLICDETGGLVQSYTFDGVHLKAKYIQIWKDYLKCHAVDAG